MKYIPVIALSALNLASIPIMIALIGINATLRIIGLPAVANKIRAGALVVSDAMLERLQAEMRKFGWA